MFPYRVSPYVHIVENRLIPNVVQYGASHLLTGEIVELSAKLRNLFSALETAKTLWLSEEDLNTQIADSFQLRRLLEKEFLIPEDMDALAPFVNRYVVRPVQNPALAYRAEDGRILLVRTSMAQHVFSPGTNDLPPVIEESLSPIAARIFLQSDGTRTLGEIYKSLEAGDGSHILEDKSFREALDFLTAHSRQLIKFAPNVENLEDPYQPFNIVPRDLYHSASWKAQPEKSSGQTIKDFHVSGIEDAAWEFDVIEPTVNHAFRFPSEPLGWLSYGSRFCLSTMRDEIFPLMDGSHRIEVLEVGGGTGTFARSFLEQVAQLRATLLKGAQLSYHILELSPVLMESQRKLLAEGRHNVTHFQQDATEFHLAGQTFDLIISNEVIADFPVAEVRRIEETERAESIEVAGHERRWDGPGASYIEKYDLPVEDAPATFMVNAGVFQFLERAWEHLAPGGTMILTEYGSEHKYPALSFHLNHEEYSIHFGHVSACARKIGFDCWLLTLKEFLGADTEVLMLDGNEEHLLCLNHVLERFGANMPYALISQKEFYERFQKILGQIDLVGFTFSPLRTGFHFGPKLDDFMALVMNKPR
ncbi:MAG: class I SAM-dependent methyltransferase [Pyrinomonadaceae bacterium]